MQLPCRLSERIVFDDLCPLQAVQATVYVDKGNVQLEKTIRVSGSARLYLLYFLIIASLALLFLDWFYS